MSRLALTSALLIALSAPAFADGKAQLAGPLGVNPADYTPAQLIRLETAVRENDTQEIAFVKAQAEGKIVSTQGTISPGLAMQAAILGVDPAKYTASQLAVMTGDAEN